MVCRLFVGLLILLNLTFPIKATEAFKKSDLTFDHFPFQNKPWVDLKLSQEYFDSSLPKKAETEPALHSLRRRIDAYHAINKTDKDLLLLRLNKLVKIQRTIKKVLETYPKLEGRHIGFHSPWRWQELERHVDNRCWYISQLYKLELQSPAEIFKNRLLPHFWEDGKVSRGLAGPWLSCQDLDPCHRGVGSLYREWYRWSSPGDPSYWMWLETQDTETMERKSPYSLEDVQGYGVEINSNNSLFSKNLNMSKEAR